MRQPQFTHGPCPPRWEKAALTQLGPPAASRAPQAPPRSPRVSAPHPPGWSRARLADDGTEVTRCRAPCWVAGGLSSTAPDHPPGARAALCAGWTSVSFLCKLLVVMETRAASLGLALATGLGRRGDTMAEGAGGRGELGWAGGEAAAGEATSVQGDEWSSTTLCQPAQDLTHSSPGGMKANAHASVLGLLPTPPGLSFSPCLPGTRPPRLMSQ